MTYSKCARLFLLKSTFSIFVFKWKEIVYNTINVHIKLTEM